MTRQFITLSYTDGGRPYTFHADHPVAIGDLVRITTPHGGSLDRPVLSFTDQPGFTTKPAYPVD